jgi:hypothetical protein
MDSDTFIEAKNGAYGFDIAPGFWELIDRKSSELVVASSTLVYGELVDHSTDDLSAWAKARRNEPLWVAPDRDVQEAYGEIAAYVAGRYPPERVAESLKGADLWLIAQARTLGGRIVTLETMVDARSRKPKIPNICAHFGIHTSNTSGMPRSLGAVFDLRS